MARGIDYGGMMHRAMQRLIADVLQAVATEGLPGDHHFFITFDTRDSGVEMADWLRERYPEEMTIVLQHQFWDLVVTDHAVEVGLSFGGIPERLLVPFTAVKGFFDPSLQFGLQFEVRDESEAEDDDDEVVAEDVETAPDAAAKPAGPRIVPTEPSRIPEIKPEPKPAVAAAPESPPSDRKTEEPPPSATVISMDSFRKKT